MKKITPNLIVNLRNNYILIQKYSSLSSKRVLLLIVFAFIGATITAQNSNTVTPQVMEVSAYISSLKTAELNSNLSFSNAKNVESLVYTIQPSVYYNSGIIKTYGDNPRNLYTDISSLNTISNADISNDNIEIIIIKIDKTSDLNSTIDLSVFSNFTKLKYIYILSSINLVDQDIIKMIQNYNEQYSIFYKVNKGE